MRIHFIGIGGVSMRQLAALLKDKGYNISGSDLSMDGHAPSNVDGADLVVYTCAVKSDNVELVRARECGIPVIERAELLGSIAAMHENVIAVSGTHGKTTTTGMLAEIFSKLSPSCHIGGAPLLPPSLPLESSSQSNKGNVPSGSIFITEACEYNRSFLHIEPTLALVLNIELDHTDCYHNKEELYAAFKQFMEKSQLCILYGDDERIYRLHSGQKITFGLNNKSDYFAFNLRADSSGCFSFSVSAFKQSLGVFKLAIAGKHNVLNALAAIAAAREYNIEVEEIKRALAHFKGISRRFELVGLLPPLPSPPLAIKYSRLLNARENYYLGQKAEGCRATDRLSNRGMVCKLGDSMDVDSGQASCQGLAPNDLLSVRIFSDYAHHPREIEAAILAARDSGATYVTVVFEPHTYSRTASLINDFCNSLLLADRIVLLPVYAARERADTQISSLDLFHKIRREIVKEKNNQTAYIGKKHKRLVYFYTYAEAIDYLRASTGKNDTIIFMGAGEIDIAARLLTEGFACQC